jgi:hypothetical protein
VGIADSGFGHDAAVLGADASRQPDVGVSGDAGPCAHPPTQIATAVSLTQYYSDGWYGYEWPPGYPIAAGGEVWFLVDPGSVDLTGTDLAAKVQIAVTISDPRQMGALVAFAYEIDANGCQLWGPLQLTPDRDWFGYNEIFANGFIVGTKYLFDIQSTMQLGLDAKWQMYNF